MHSPGDTIAAIATAPGPAGLAVVRISGSEALAITDRVFRGRTKLTGVGSHTVHHGWAHAPAAPCPTPGRRTDEVEGVAGVAPSGSAGGNAPRLDEVVAAVFRAPHSYTGEDVVEISCHGGRLSAGRVLAALLECGVRLARPGEFTLRAFLGGRIDLAQAEAVADVIHAETESAHRLALDQLAGALSRRLGELAERLEEALAEVEARVDFAEDVGGIEVPPQVVEAIEAAGGELAMLLASASYGRAVREGVRFPLAGRPNVGKSSLFNALVGEERAIVTPLPGTTRDRVSESIEIRGIRVSLSDTAGLRPTGDVVESLGVERARAALDESRHVLWVVDGAVAADEADRSIAALLAGKRVLVALNKSDLPAAVTPADVMALLGGAAWCRVVAVSATRGTGLDALREGLAEALGVLPDDDAAAARGAAVTNARHVDSLRRAGAALERAHTAARGGVGGEIVALELRECLEGIGEVTGRTVAEDLLDRIFARFCVGK